MKSTTSPIRCGGHAGKRILFCGIVLLAAATLVSAQQVADLDFKPPIPRPAYESGKGPHIAMDGAHHNFFTVDGRAKPFAELLRRDGYRVDGLEKPFSADALNGVDVLVIANALNERNVNDWALPAPSAFRADEIAAVHAWVEKGGSLFLIVDHLPFSGCAGDLAKAFGVNFNNGFAVSKSAGRLGTLIFGPATGLRECAITQGRGNDEKVTEVATFIGSAFMPPKDATPILVFDGDFEILKPTKAWQFTPDTPKEPLDGWCQGAVMKVGKGRVAVFGEAAMFTAQLAGAQKQTLGMNAPEAKQNYQFVLNIMHWLTRAKGMPD